MKRDTVSIVIFIMVAFAALSVFIPFAVNYIGSSQDDVISWTKKVEKY